MVQLDALPFKDDQKPLLRELEAGLTDRNISLGVAYQVAAVAFQTIERLRAVGEIVDAIDVLHTAEVALDAQLHGSDLDNKDLHLVKGAIIGLVFEVLDATGVEYTDADLCGEDIADDSWADLPAVPEEVPEVSEISELPVYSDRVAGGSLTAPDDEVVERFPAGLPADYMD